MLSLGGLCIYGVLVGELRESVGDVRELLDKPTVKIGESSKGLYIFDATRGVSFLYGFNLLRVHADAFRGDNQTKVCNCVGVEFAFIRFQ